MNSPNSNITQPEIIVDTDNNSGGDEAVETTAQNTLTSLLVPFNAYKFYCDCMSSNEKNENPDLNNSASWTSNSALPPAPLVLNFLKGVSHFILKQNLNPLDIGVPYSDEALKYDVFDETGKRLMITAEASKYCKICCCKTDRPFQFFILNPEGQQILIISRPCGCGCCLGVCCLGDMYCNKVNVTLVDGTLVGTVVQKFGCCKPIYILKNSIGEKNFRITGPKCAFCCPCRICCDTQFLILTARLPPRKDGSKSKPKRVKLGEIKQDWIEFRNPIFFEGDNFGASFPVDCDTRLKATILGAIILINFLHFHKDPCAPTQFCC